MKIIIADDHAIVREGLKQILSDSLHITSIDDVSDGIELLNKIQKNDYDIIILDISMPGKSGIETLRDIKSIKPNIPVLMLSIHPEEQYAIRVLKAGASGFISKDSAPDELIAAVEKIIGGHKYITPTLAEKLASEISPAKDKPAHEYLSNREFEVFKMIAAGNTITEIANSFNLSVKTISTYRARIYEKMNLSSRAELTQYAIQNKLIE